MWLQCFSFTSRLPIHPRFPVKAQIPAPEKVCKGNCESEVQWMELNLR